MRIACISDSDDPRVNASQAVQDPELARELRELFVAEGRLAGAAGRAG